MIGQKNTHDQVDPKTIWLNIGLIVMVLGLAFAQLAMSLSNQNIKIAQANNIDNPSQTNQSVDIESQREYSKYDIQIQNIRQTRDNLSIDYSLVNFDSESGKAYVGFYFDQYEGGEKANIYYGSSPFNMPNEYVPVGFKKICSAIFLPNLERLNNTETCEEFITSQ